MYIRVLVTGGTFDKEYDPLTGNLDFDKTHIPEMLNMGRCRANVAVETLMMIDSLEMTDSNRADIAEKCTQIPEKMIVITHGTDTMQATAAYLANKNIEKTIILTGALIPYKFGSSDGFFNLGQAIAFAQSLEKGVYIAMNGRYFPWNNVVKDKKTGFFEEIED